MQIDGSVRLEARATEAITKRSVKGRSRRVV